VQPVLRGLILAIGMLVMPVAAQAQTRAVPATEILIIDPDRLYLESEFGKRVLAEQQADAAILAAEYRRIEAELTEEERTLTDKRPSMSPEDFRSVAEAFDERVESIRELQQQRENEIVARGEAERQRFFVQLGPVLEVVLRESGALVVLEQRSVFASRSSLDVTDLVLEQANIMFGDGTETEVETTPDAPQEN
jgi:Skp family chaperone for outer membrane proteins